MSMEITSGELYFQKYELDFAGCDDLMSSLRIDSQDNLQVEYVRDRLNNLRQLRLLSRKIHSRILRSDLESSSDLTLEVKTGLLDDLSSVIEKYKVSLRKEQNKIEAGLLHWSLQYFALLKDSILRTRVRLHGDAKFSVIGTRQAKMKRDLKLYAHSLEMETKGAVKLNLVAQDSSQYKRCCKAVTDSLGSSFQRKMPGFESVKVLNVFKLEHSWLSILLQQAASCTETAKVKGLFCAVPRKQIYNMCAYGLFDQRLDGLPIDDTDDTDDNHAQNQNTDADNEIENNDREYNDDFEIDEDDNGDNNASDVGKNEKKSESSSRRRSSISIFDGRKDADDPRMRCSLFSYPWFSTVNSDNNNGNSSNNSPCIARKLATEHALKEPRFSRSSAPPALSQRPWEELVEGTYLALCRVLISRLRMVDDPLSEQLVEESVSLGYDAVYSTYSEEYLLLNPHHVLPEFVMHIQLKPTEENMKQNRNDLTKELLQAAPIPTCLHQKVPSLDDVYNLGGGNKSNSNGSTDNGSSGGKPFLEDPVDILQRNEVDTHLSWEQTVDWRQTLVRHYTDQVQMETRTSKDHGNAFNDMSKDANMDSNYLSPDGSGTGVRGDASREALFVKQNLCANIRKAADLFHHRSGELLRGLRLGVKTKTSDK